MHALLIPENNDKPIYAWLLKTFNGENPEHQQALLDYYQAHNTIKALKKYEVALVINGQFEPFKKLAAACQLYLDGASAEFMPPMPGELSQQISEFNQVTEQLNEDPMTPAIKNYFANWFSLEPEQRTTLYKMLNPVTKQKLSIDDATIDALLSSTVDGTLTMTPDLINRVFLHAILFLPRADKAEKPWSPKFAGLFENTLNFVKNNFNAPNTANGSALKRSSYPPSLLEQMEYLLKLHNMGAEEEAPQRPAQMIVIPEDVQTWIQFLEIIAIFGGRDSPNYKKAFVENIQRYIAILFDKYKPANESVNSNFHLSFA